MEVPNEVESVVLWMLVTDGNWTVMKGYVREVLMKNKKEEDRAGIN